MVGYRHDIDARLKQAVNDLLIRYALVVVIERRWGMKVQVPFSPLRPGWAVTRNGSSVLYVSHCDALT